MHLKLGWVVMGAIAACGSEPDGNGTGGQDLGAFDGGMQPDRGTNQRSDFRLARVRLIPSMAIPGESVRVEVDVFAGDVTITDFEVSSSRLNWGPDRPQDNGILPDQIGDDATYTLGYQVPDGAEPGPYSIAAIAVAQANRGPEVFTSSTATELQVVTR